MKSDILYGATLMVIAGINLSILFTFDDPQSRAAVMLPAICGYALALGVAPHLVRPHGLIALSVALTCLLPLSLAMTPPISESPVANVALLVIGGAAALTTSWFAVRDQSLQREYKAYLAAMETKTPHPAP